MRPPFSNTETMVHPRDDASLTYHGYGSAGGNPDKRADTHMWRYRVTLGTDSDGTPNTVDGLISIWCRAHLDAAEDFDARHGKGAWFAQRLRQQYDLIARVFQTRGQAFIVSDCDDAAQSFPWGQLSAAEFDQAVRVLKNLVRQSQTSPQHNDTVLMRIAGQNHIL